MIKSVRMAGPRTTRPPSGAWGSIAPQPPIAQYPHHVAVDRQRVWLLDNESAGKAAAYLLGAMRMRVIPIGAGIRYRELVGEAFAGLHRRLRDVRSAVHGVRDAQPVPMDRGVLGQPVLHHDPDAIALANSDFRPWRLPAVAPNIGLGIRGAGDRQSYGDSDQSEFLCWRTRVGTTGEQRCERDARCARQKGSPVDCRTERMKAHLQPFRRRIEDRLR